MIHRFAAAADGFDAGARLWDVCVVGAGAAGLAIASQFLDTPRQIIVLESGLEEPDATADELNTLSCVGMPHDGWKSGRVRSFGGTTRAWGGQLVPMRSSELEARAWVPGSGWPLHLDELQPYYRKAERILQIEGPPYDSAAWARLNITPPLIDEARFHVRFSQWAALGRRNFALLWHRELQRSRNVMVLLDATAAAVVCTDGHHCDSVEVRSRSGRRASIRARCFVLACGGIEIPRLLLASPSLGGNGLANSSNLVGRYFQDHISYIAGELEPSSRRAVQGLFDPRYVRGTMFSMKLEPSYAAMSERRWLNAMGHVAFEIPDALGWLEVRRILRSIQAGRLEVPSVRESLAMLRGGADLTRLILARTFAKRRRSPDKGRILLLVDCEQAPNPDSRIVLDTAVDALGMRRARLDWRVSELELRTLREFAAELSIEIERLGLGRIRLAPGPDFHLREIPGAARDIFHHMGTTRMSLDPRKGVTRPDLRCHDLANLYIAGPSVFPSGGIANPTFTALALCLRLADELARVTGTSPDRSKLDVPVG
jgi:choline dehydrogenase-like flavoprotein